MEAVSRTGPQRLAAPARPAAPRRHTTAAAIPQYVPYSAQPPAPELPALVFQAPVRLAPTAFPSLPAAPNLTTLPVGEFAVAPQGCALVAAAAADWRQTCGRGGGGAAGLTSPCVCVCCLCRSHALMPDSPCAELLDQRATAPHWGSQALSDAAAAAAASLRPAGAHQLAAALRDVQTNLSAAAGGGGGARGSVCRHCARAGATQQQQQQLQPADTKL